MFIITCTTKINFEVTLKCIKEFIYIKIITNLLRLYTSFNEVLKDKLRNNNEHVNAICHPYCKVLSVSNTSAYKQAITHVSISCNYQRHSTRKVLSTLQQSQWSDLRYLVAWHRAGPLPGEQILEESVLWGIYRGMLRTVRAHLSLDRNAFEARVILTLKQLN